MAQIGIKTGQVVTGNVRTQELREVEHFGHTERVALDHQTKQQLEHGRQVIKQERSLNQAPTDVTGARHLSTLKNSSYRRENDDNQYSYGQKRVDESRVVEKVSTYNRSELNKEERSFGGVDRHQTEMQYRSSRVEQPVETRVSYRGDHNLQPDLRTSMNESNAWKQ